MASPTDQREDVVCNELTWTMIIAQVIGLFIILGAVWLLHDLSWKSKIFSYLAVVMGFCFLLITLLWSWWDAVLNFLAHLLNNIPESEPWGGSLASPKRKQRLIKATLLLVMGDTILLGVLIRVTGGFAHSPLDPLLPVIPVIAIILKQPRKTIMWILGLQFFAAASGVFHWGLHWLSIPHPEILDSKEYEAYKDPNLLLAFSFVAGGSMFLSFIEYVVTHRRSPLLWSIRTLRLQIKKPAEQIFPSVERGTKNWINFLDWRMLPTKDLSVVHRPEAIGHQALILATPYWNGEAGYWDQEDITEKITFLTYAAHWIDDHFDPVQDSKSPLAEMFQNDWPADFIKRDARLQGLIANMEKRVKPNNRTQVTRAVARIIYGGLIQNATTKERMNDLLEEYSEYVSNDLAPEIREIYMHFLRSENVIVPWITTKVVIELFDACSPQFNANHAEFYTLLYSPILYYQDIKAEMVNERFGWAFAPIAEVLPTTASLLDLVTRVCGPLTNTVFKGEMIPESRRVQLEELLKAYGSELPDPLSEAYEQFLANQQVSVIHELLSS